MTADAATAMKLETGSRVYGAYAAERLLADHPETAGRFGPNAFSSWKTNLAQRITELAAAVEVGRPEMFVTQIRWTQGAFAARDVAVDDLRLSLECLGAVLSEQLPGAEGVVDTYVAPAIAALATTPSSDGGLRGDSPATRVALGYLEAALGGERRKAIDVVLSAVDRGEITVPEAYVNVLAAAEVEIGRLWHAGELNIAEEHLATSTTNDVFALLHHRTTPAPSNGCTVILAAVTGNGHDIGVRIVADLFALAGWRAIHLGANMPARDIAYAANAFEADLVVLSAMIGTHVRYAGDAITAVRAARPGAQIMVGGLAFDTVPDLWQTVGADGYAATPDDALAFGAGLVDL